MIETWELHATLLRNDKKETDAKTYDDKIKQLAARLRTSGE